MDLPRQWQKYPEPRGTLREGSYPDGYAARGKPGVKAHDAVQSFRSQNSELDCHAGAQLTVLDAADAVLGATRFNALHPVRAWPNLPAQDDGRPSKHALAGLGVPLLRDAEMNEPQFWFGSHVIELSDYTSLAKHLFVVRYHLPTGFRNRGSRDTGDSAFAGPIKAADMVPGDWAYITNVPDYDRLVGGANAGENVFYISELRPGAASSRVFFGVGLEQLRSPPRFSPRPRSATTCGTRSTKSRKATRSRPNQGTWSGPGSAARPSTASTPWREGPSSRPGADRAGGHAVEPGRRSA
jgi:hypothetical protein